MPTPIAFFGSSPFSVPFLETLIREQYTISVVTQPDQPQGRLLHPQPNALKARALSYHLPIYEEKLNRSLIQWWQERALTPLCAVVASFGRIIPQFLLQMPDRGMLNVHPSLLPRHRGASPIQWTILEGDAVTGLTIILIDSELDNGPIIAQERRDVYPSDTTPILKERLALLGCAMLSKILPQWLNAAIVPTPQEHTQATFTKTLARKDGHLDWLLGAQRLERQMRAFTPWPGSWSLWQRHGKTTTLKWHEGHVGQQRVRAEPGKVLPSSTNGIDVACADGTVLTLATVQMEGRTITDAASFLNGHRDILGSILH